MLHDINYFSEIFQMRSWFVALSSHSMRHKKHARKSDRQGLQELRGISHGICMSAAITFASPSFKVLSRPTWSYGLTWISGRSSGFRQWLSCNPSNRFLLIGADLKIFIYQPLLFEVTKQWGPNLEDCVINGCTREMLLWQAPCRAGRIQNKDSVPSSISAERLLNEAHWMKCAPHHSSCRIMNETPLTLKIYTCVLPQVVRRMEVLLYIAFKPVMNDLLALHIW